MRLRVLLVASLTLNVAIAALWLATQWQLPAPQRPIFGRIVVTNTNVIRVPKPFMVERREPFTWRDLESTNYVTFIQNLRQVGCPAPTIRDIIVADVNQLYAHRRARELPPPSFQWWRSEPDVEALVAAEEKREQLDRERRALLTQLLGPGWEEAEGDPLAPDREVRLEGPHLAELTEDTRRLVREIETRSRQRADAYRETQERAGQPTDAAELARLRQQTRDELARVLTPPQLEEYLLRYSQNAQELRETLLGFHATPEEFRGLFRVRDPLDRQLQMLGDAGDPAVARRRAELEAQRDAAARAVLSPERFEAYKLQQEPAFRQARTTVEQLGGAPETVLPLYEINRTSDAERRRILDDRSLSLDQRRQALIAVEQQQQRSVQQLLKAQIEKAAAESRQP